MSDETWPSDWLRGVLPMAVMGVLADGPTYGYAIAQRLKEGAIGEVKGGTLYPLLQRLENDAYVEARWQQGESGPGRKYFELTPAGRAELVRRRDAWLRFTRTVGDLLNTVKEPS